MNGDGPVRRDFAKWIRDEIRLIAPGMYLGVVFMGKKKTIDFVLVFPK